MKITRILIKAVQERLEQRRIRLEEREANRQILIRDQEMRHTLLEEFEIEEKQKREREREEMEIEAWNDEWLLIYNSPKEQERARKNMRKLSIETN